MSEKCGWYDFGTGETCDGEATNVSCCWGWGTDVPNACFKHRCRCKGQRQTKLQLTDEQRRAGWVIETISGVEMKVLKTDAVKKALLG